MSFLSQLTIQQRTYLNISLTLVSIILIAFSVWLDISKLNQLSNLRLNTAYLETHVLELRKHEKDFLARNDIKYIGKFDKEIDLLKRKIQSLHINLNEFDIDISELIKFENKLNTLASEDDIRKLQNEEFFLVKNIIYKNKIEEINQNGLFSILHHKKIMSHSIIWESMLFLNY